MDEGKKAPYLKPGHLAATTLLACQILISPPNTNLADTCYHFSVEKLDFFNTYSSKSQKYRSINIYYFTMANY
jgi:hypothetical protein